MPERGEDLDLVRRLEDVLEAPQHARVDLDEGGRAVVHHRLRHHLGHRGRQRRGPGGHQVLLDVGIRHGRARIASASDRNRHGAPQVRGRAAAAGRPPRRTRSGGSSRPWPGSTSARPDPARRCSPPARGPCAWASRPASTFRLPFREQTIPVIAQPTETIDDRPNEITSRPTATTREHEARDRLPVVRHGRLPRPLGRLAPAGRRSLVAAVAGRRAADSRAEAPAGSPVAAADSRRSAEAAARRCRWRGLGLALAQIRLGTGGLRRQEARLLHIRTPCRSSPSSSGAPCPRARSGGPSAPRACA